MKIRKSTLRKNAATVAGDAYTLANATTVAVPTLESQLFRLTPTANRTLNFLDHRAGNKFVLAIKQDATGSRLITWDSEIRWSGGTAPTLTTTAAKTDFFEFFDTGTYYIGRTLGLNFTEA